MRNDQPGENRLNWAIVPVLMLFHVGAVAAPFFFSWRALFVAIFLYWVTGGLGLGICYHRLLTHRSFATPKWFEYFLRFAAWRLWKGALSSGWPRIVSITNSRTRKVTRTLRAMASGGRMRVGS